MNSESKYWKWKNIIIDFDNINKEKVKGQYYTKAEYVFHYLGTPDKTIHEWYNGGYSSEYNEALGYAYELDLVEDYINYGDEIYNLQQENKQLKEIIEKAKEYINNNSKLPLFSEGDLNNLKFNGNVNNLLDILNGDDK